MLRFLQSIFGTSEQEIYPESLIREAVERAVDATDSQVRAVSGYKKKLRPAILQAIDHVVALVEGLPPPMPVSLGTSDEHLPIKSFFISAIHMKKFFAEDPNLAEFMRGPGGSSPQIIALLAMEKQEKTIFGAALSGDIVIRDVPQVTVSFDGHRLLDPSANEGETRRLLKRRAYDHLLSLALRRLTSLKDVRTNLERRRELHLGNQRRDRKSRCRSRLGPRPNYWHPYCRRDVCQQILHRPENPDAGERPRPRREF